MSRRLTLGLGEKAVVAVEFAICLPILLILLLGTAEMLMLYRTEAKLDQVTSNFAEMVSLAINSPVAASGSPGLTDLCQGVLDGLQPFPASGLTIAVASVTETKAAGTTNGKTTSATYGEWEVDLTSSCATTSSQAIGTTGTTGAVTIATGSGTSANAVLQGLGDNMIIVRASLKYPGVIGLFLTSAETLTQTALTRWRYASSTAISSSGSSSTLEFLCSGTNCNTHTCSSSTTCT